MPNTVHLRFMSQLNSMDLKKSDSVSESKRQRIEDEDSEYEYDKEEYEYDKNFVETEQRKYNLKWSITFEDQKRWLTLLIDEQKIFGLELPDHMFHDVKDEFGLLYHARLKAQTLGL